MYHSKSILQYADFQRNFYFNRKKKKRNTRKVKSLAKTKKTGHHRLNVYPLIETETFMSSILIQSKGER